jgi:Domain of unknown function (DUF222)/HNH endonuclease
MSSTYAEPLDRLDAVLDELAVIGPEFRTLAERQEFLLRVARVKARVVAEELRVLAASDDIAGETGDRSTASWLATQTRDAHGTVRRHAALAAGLGSRWTQTAEALGAGEVNLAQARVIVEALEALPEELGEDLVVKAEAYLVEQAGSCGPRELRHLGRCVLEHLAPEIADEGEYQRLLAEEEAASASTRLMMRRRGDGSTDIHARVPDATAGRLSTFLNAYTAPRRHHDERLPIERLRGEGFVALLENIPTDSLPRHGGVATTLMVIVDHERLISGVGVATTSTGDPMSVGQVRRLACQAGVLPVVLGGKSEILDLGRARRLVSDAIRKALNLRDRGCTATGCGMPAEFCEAHHIVPWSRGGRTTLADTKLLCSFHHHRAHDPGWQTHHQPNGTTSFSRRQ